MYKLINRITWILSILLGMSIAFILKISGGFSVLFWIVFWMIFKSLFFSEDFIKDGMDELSFHKKKKASSEESAENDQEESFSHFEKKEISSFEDEFFDFKKDENIQKSSENQESAFAEKSFIKTESEEKKSVPAVEKEPNFIEKFFAENALAKIGGIFLFLWVLFFLSLLYNSAWPVAKIIIWFIAGFIFFLIGIFLDKKWYTNESRTLLGVAILVNYLVILSGRYLVGGNWILTEGITFTFLILNTIFAITTSLVYKSKTLLLFSFVFAFLNPFLIGSKWDGTPYTLVWYSTIISIWAIILSHLYYKDKENDFTQYLSYVGFIGWNILFLLAPFSTPTHWLIKLICIWIISFSTILLSYKNNEKTNIWTFFVWTYIVFAMLLISGWTANILNMGISFIWYIAFIIIALAMSVFVITSWSIASLGYILFAPLIIIFWMLVSWSLFFIVPVLMGTLFIYLIIFSFLYEVLSAWFRYVFFVGLCIFLFLSNFTLKFVIPQWLDDITYLSIIISSLVFLFSAYFFSRKEKLEYLYTIGTLGTIFLLFPIIATSGWFMTESIGAIVVFALANIFTPFINRNLYQKELKNLAISLVAGVIFIAGELYNFWEIAKLFPWLSLGYSFVGLAILYFFLAYVLMNLSETNFTNLSTNVSEERKNSIFWYLGISLSLFSIAILILFSSQPAIIASIWFFESTLLFFFFSRTKESKIFVWAFVLFLIGILKFWTFITHIENNNFTQFLPLIAIFISFILNLKFLETLKEGKRIAYDMVHIIAIIMLGAWIISIVNIAWKWFEFFALSIFFVILGIVYNLFSSSFLRSAFVVLLCLYYFVHISDINNILNQSQLNILQYFAIAMPWVWLYFRSKNPWKFDDIKRFLVPSYIVYVFIITTKVIYNITNDNIFAVSIYWALWSFYYISSWINNDNQKRRTIGLYILSWVIIKILFYDIWVWIDDAIVRVVALMFIGGLMIYISTLYSRKYSTNLLGEFSLNNLDIKIFQDTEKKSSDNSQEKFINEPEKNAWNNSNTQENKISSKRFIINEKIDKIEIGNIKSVIFKVKGANSFKIRAKNLIKIAKLIEKNTKKTKFEANELKNIYDYVMKNYQTELSPTDYKKIGEVVKLFVENGWEIIFEEL